jgi:hypothetical protein
MEEIRTEDETRRMNDDERAEYNASAGDDEVPFHIPRD